MDTINLLHVSQGETSHYCLIRNFNRLMGGRTKHKEKKFYCYHCLHGFSRQDLLDQHKPNCQSHVAQRIDFPKKEKDKWVYFKDYARQLKVPFVIYADFECFTTPIDNCAPDPDRSSTTKYQHHRPCSYSYVVVSAVEGLTKTPILYRGEDPVSHFLDDLQKEEKEIAEILNDSKPMKITDAQEQAFKDAQNCHICGKPLGADRVRDHDHLTGLFRGAAHNECNLQYKFKKGKKKDSFFIPVILHNLRNYDSHLIMEAIGKYKDRRIDCIPNTIEKYISFSLGNLRFIDSFQFLGTSLEKLTQNLAREGLDKFHILKDNVHDQNQRELLLRKGVYPYDYVSGPDRFDDKTLPDKAAFYSRLHDENISDGDYAHAQQVWNAFHCQTLGEYHDIYLRSDVMLLADIFENFRNISLESYQLDPAHYFTAPGLSWDAMLKLTGVRLELIDDIDQYLMIESGLRGGISMISNKYAKANNPYLSNYEPDRSSNYIMYYDANNLYGWSQSRFLPDREFDWMTDEQLDNFDVMQISDESDTGYILDVDLEYPQHFVYSGSYNRCYCG